MALTPFRRITTSNQDLMRVQDAVEASVKGVLGIPFLNQNTVTVDLSTSVTEVAHGLGRPIEGWLVSRKNAAGDVYEGATSIAPNKSINLVATASVRVTIVFY